MTRGALRRLGAAATLAFAGSFVPSLPAAPKASTSPFRMIVVIEPACPQAISMLERVAEFRRVRPDLPVRLLLADPAALARAGEAVLTLIQREDLELEWDPVEFRTLGVAVSPAVVVRDSTGRGVRAAGTPDLTALARAAEGR